MPIIKIKRNSDGVVREYKDEYPWDETMEYLWSEGNYGCDCNRALFFSRAVGDDDPDRECGYTEFSIEILDDNGKLLYSEDDNGKILHTEFEGEY